jgi:hypothetical protein
MELKGAIIQSILAEIDDAPCYKGGFEIYHNGQVIWCEMYYHIYFTNGNADVTFKIIDLGFLGGCDIDTESIVNEVCQIKNKKLDKVYFA